jgi:hypothetical protein
LPTHAGWLSGFHLTIRAASPVDDLGLVDLVASLVRSGETGGDADRAVNVHHAAADAADQMVVVVANPGLEAGGRPGRLNAPDQAFGDQDGEAVIHRLEGDRPDFGPDGVGHGVGRGVGLTRDSPQDGQPLGRYLNSALAKEVSQVGGHESYDRSQ